MHVPLLLMMKAAITMVKGSALLADLKKGYSLAANGRRVPEVKAR